MASLAGKGFLAPVTSTELARRRPCPSAALLEGTGAGRPDSGGADGRVDAAGRSRGCARDETVTIPAPATSSYRSRHRRMTNANSRKLAFVDLVTSEHTSGQRPLVNGLAHGDQGLHHADWE